MAWRAWTRELGRGGPVVQGERAGWLAAESLREQLHRREPLGLVLELDRIVDQLLCFAG